MIRQLLRSRAARLIFGIAGFPIIVIIVGEMLGAGGSPALPAMLGDDTTNRIEAADHFIAASASLGGVAMALVAAAGVLLRVPESMKPDRVDWALAMAAVTLAASAIFLAYRFQIAVASAVAVERFEVRRVIELIKGEGMATLLSAGCLVALTLDRFGRQTT